MKKLFLVLFFTLLLNTAFASSVQAAEGDLVWQDDYPEISRMDQAWANPSNKPINIVQDTLYLGQWVNVTTATGDAKIFKRTHGALGWEAPLTMPMGGNPVYVQLLSAADDSGVYIANPTHIAQNLSNGRLALSKLDTNGVFIKNINQISQNFTTVSYIVVDDTGVYVSGGSGAGWVVEKWSKDLNTSLWKYYSQQSGGNACDSHGPRSIVRDDSYLYLGGCVLNVHSGLTTSRLEKVNKTNKHQEWVKIDGSAPGIGVMAIDSGNLYIGAGAAYWGGWSPPNTYSSVLQKRTLNNDPVIWTQPFNSERIIALAVDNDGIYRGFIDANSKMMKVDKRKLSDGTLLSPKVITSGITAYEVTSNPLPGFVLSYKDNMSIDSTGIYLAGALGTQCGGGACYRVGGRVEKYGHLGPQNCGTVTDADGNTYDTVVIGTQCWMKQNMRVGTKINAPTAQTNNGTIEKYCYNNDPNNCTTNHPNYPDGGHYTWDEAMQYSTTPGAQGICPAGWHIPTDAEWHTLEAYLTDAGQTCNPNRINVPIGTGYDCATAGTKLKQGGSSGFEANYSGSFGWSGAYVLRDDTGYFLSSTELGANDFWYRVLTVSPFAPTKIARISFLKTGGTMSVRCVQGAGAGQPDLTAQNLTPASAASFVSTNAITFTGRAVNSAAAAVAEGGWADLEIDTNNNGVSDNKHNAFGGVKLGAFAVSDTKNLSYTLPAGTLPVGNYHYRFHVDTDGTGVVESDETNNHSEWVPFTVTAPAQCSAGETLTWTDGTETCKGVSTGPWNVGDTLTIGDTLTANIGTATFSCGAGGVWDPTPLLAACSAPPPPPLIPPTITITATPALIRSGNTADIEVEINDAVSDLSCTVLGVDPGAVDPENFNHDHTSNPTTQSYVTKTLKSTQIVQVKCSDGTNTTTKEIRVEVVPTVQEI
jgi:uncharacterized protein (TIGR02145 family)